MKKECDHFCPAEVQGIVSDLHGVYITCLTSAARVLINLRHDVTHDDHASTPAEDILAGSNVSFYYLTTAVCD